MKLFTRTFNFALGDMLKEATLDDLRQAAKEFGCVVVSGQELKTISKLLGAWSTDYAQHVYKRNGNGDESDLLSYVAAEAAE